MKLKNLLANLPDSSKENSSEVVKKCEILYKPKSVIIVWFSHTTRTEYLSGGA